MRSYFTKKRSSQDGKRSSLFGFLNKKPATIPAYHPGALDVPELPQDVGKHITFKIADHDAKEFNWYGRRGEVNALQALPQIWRPTDSHVRELLQSSFTTSSSFSPNDGGFVNTLVDVQSGTDAVAPVTPSTAPATPSLVHGCCPKPFVAFEAKLLLGTKEDYLSIYQRLDKLEEFGREPTAFAQLLRPVIKQFAAVFDAVEEGKRPDPDFWGRICHYHRGGSGPDYISGWISAFAVWNKNGQWQGGDIDLIDKPGFERVIIDGIRYPSVNTDDIPPGTCEVDVKLNDNGLELDCVMVAGHIGNTISATGSEAIMNTLQPQS